MAGGVQFRRQPNIDECDLQREFGYKFRWRDVQLRQQPDADGCDLQQQFGWSERRGDVQAELGDMAEYAGWNALKG